jgi:hypothetical protein
LYLQLSPSTLTLIFEHPSQLCFWNQDMFIAQSRKGKVRFSGKLSLGEIFLKINL